MTRSEQQHSLLLPIQSWDRDDVRTLLWRAGFGGSGREVDKVAQLGPEEAVRLMVDGVDESREFEATQTILHHSAFDGDSIEHLRSWWLYRMLHSHNPLHERMTLFWHNHFATSYTKVKSVPAMAAQNDLFREHATGSFRELLQLITKNVAMLVWLDGNANRKREPNENFARELMELFSLGVGHYTEQDIQEAARAFTGWHVRQNQFWFNRNQHDFETKTVLGKTGNLNGEQIVELCLDQAACPRFLATKLLREFVSATPSLQELDAVADLIQSTDFDMSAVLQTLLCSRLFYSSRHRGRLIKSPVDLVIGTFRMLERTVDLNVVGRTIGDLGQILFMPPTVKGWEGHRHWLNSATLLLRIGFASDVVRSQRFGESTLPADLDDQLRSPPARQRFVENAWSLPVEDFSQPALSALNSSDPIECLHIVLTSPEYQLK